MRRAKFLQFTCTSCTRSTFADNNGQEVYPGELVDQEKRDCPVCGTKTAHFVSGANAADKREARGEPATERQLNYIRNLGATPPANLTKWEASRMIDRLTGKVVQPQNVERRDAPPRRKIGSLPYSLRRYGIIGLLATILVVALLSSLPRANDDVIAIVGACGLIPSTTMLGVAYFLILKR